MLRKLLLLAPFALIANISEAQCPNGRCSPQGVTYYFAYSNAPRVVATQAVAYAGGDVYSFGSWVNGVRARYGRAPLAYDPGLASLAAANSSRGFGHHGFHRGYEAVAMGSPASAGAQWLASPAHVSILLAPGIRHYGFAHINGVSTFCGR